MPSIKHNSDDLDKKLEYFDVLKNKREKWNSIWDELKKYVCPQTSSTKTVFDSTSIWSREQLASGLQSLIVSSATKWFGIEFETEEDLEEQDNSEELLYCSQIIQKRILGIFNNPASNFYNQIHEFFLNLAAFGTSIFYVEEDPNLPTLLFFRNISLKECYFEEDRFGFINCLYRLFNLPIKVAAQQWPDNKELQEKALKTPDEQIEILHIVMPAEGIIMTNSNLKKTAGTKASLAYSSQYVYLTNRTILSESGYSYFPFLVTRWIKEEGEPYGYAPAQHVLPDIKLLNNLRQITLKTAQKQLDPPLLVPKDGYHLPLYTTPGSVNFYRNGMADKIVPLTGMENRLPTEIEQNQCREAIHKAFYIDIFRMQKENREMTATEVAVRNEEQMRMMIPMVGRIESEFLSPLINIVYQTLLKYNRLPELQKLGIADIRPVYISPLSRAQKASSVNAVEQVLAFFQQIGIGAMSPEIYDNMDWDKCFKLTCELKGVPQEILKKDSEVAQIRQQRAAQLMEQQQIQEMQQMEQLRQQNTMR